MLLTLELVWDNDDDTTILILVSFALSVCLTMKLLHNIIEIAVGLLVGGKSFEYLLSLFSKKKP